MRRTLKIIYWGWLAGLCFNASLLNAAESVAARLLVYQVTESGASPYISRILVTPDHLRLDQGQQEQAFILFDRKAGVIYSVNPEDRTILIVDPQATPVEAQAGPTLSATQVKLAGTPDVGGRQPQQWQFHTNGRLCLTAVVVAGLMQDATLAYGEYLALLSRQHHQSLSGIPPEMRDSCDLAINVYSPLAVLEKGLPLRESQEAGRQQTLVDFREDFEVPSSSFSLPADYRTIRVGEF